MKKDYLIVGQGVAGSLLAWQLKSRGKSVLIVDDNHKQSSSMISAGIINPVTGKRFAIFPEFDHFFSYAKDFYAGLEEFFQEKFFESKPILRMFKNEDERRKVDRKDALHLLNQYCEKVEKQGVYHESLDDSLGSVLITQSGICFTSKLLMTLRNYFMKEGDLQNKNFKNDDISIQKDSIQYDGMTFTKVIFCEGYQAQFNPWFEWLPFNSVKGEILKIEMDSAGLPEAVLNKGKWCVPSGENQWTCGASYIWDDLDCIPTESGKQDVLSGVNALIHKDKKVIDHFAAVRPVMKDQKPICGLHPEMPSIGIFNGLGSKGFLLAPFYAEELSRFYLGEGRLAPDVDVGRFSQLCPKNVLD